MKQDSKTVCKNEAVPAGSPHYPRLANYSAPQAGPPRHLTPSPQGPQSYLPLPPETAWNCVSGPTAQCTAVTPYTLSCSSHGKLMGWLVGKRVVLELSGDGEAEDCSRAPVHLVPPSALLAWQAPDGPGSF